MHKETFIEVFKHLIGLQHFRCSPFHYDEQAFISAVSIFVDVFHLDDMFAVRCSPVQLDFSSRLHAVMQNLPSNRQLLFIFHPDRSFVS